MPIHDYIISNGTGAAVRADINSALSAIVSLNSNASEPGTMYAYQLWADTAAGLLKIRNGANSAWVTLRQLDGDFSIVAVEDGLQATPSLTITNDLNTGVFRSGADALAIVTGGQYAIACTSTQAVGIRTPNPSTALHVAGNARVGADDVTDAHLQIGKGASGNRNSYIDIVADTTYTDYGLRIIRNNTGANATSELKHRGTGALNFTTQEAAPIVFNTTNSPRVAIDSDGRLLVGTSTDTNNARLQEKLALVTIGSGNIGGMAITNYGGTGAGSRPLLDFQRSRGTTDGSFTAVASGDQLGSIIFRGADGSQFADAAFINCEVDGTPGASDMPGRLVFSTTPNSGSSPTERMRISNYGRIDMRTDTGSFGGSGIPTLGLFQSGDTTLTQYFIYGAHSATGYSGTNCFAVLNNGNVIKTNNSYGAISDIKLKENIIDASSQWADIKALQVRKYNFREETGQQTHTQIGLVAQEVELVSPGLVNESPDRDAEGNDLGTVTKGVNYSVLYMKAVKALQEAMERIETLETSNADMLARVTALEAA